MKVIVGGLKQQLAEDEWKCKVEILYPKSQNYQYKVNQSSLGCDAIFCFGNDLLNFQISLSCTDEAVHSINKLSLFQTRKIWTR